MNARLLDLELPAFTQPDRPVPLVSAEDALRWRIAKHAGSKPLPREKPQGEPFEWIDEPSSEDER